MYAYLNILFFKAKGNENPYEDLRIGRHFSQYDEHASVNQ